MLIISYEASENPKEPYNPKENIFEHLDVSPTLG